MPRLTNRHFIETFLELNQLWLDQRHVFMDLSPTEQRYLHEYFRLSENLKASELMAHRKHISRQRPSLPQCAGRALAKLQAMVEQPVVVPIRAGKAGGKRVVKVRSLVRPRIAADDMTRALRLAASEKRNESQDTAA